VAQRRQLLPDRSITLRAHEAEKVRQVMRRRAERRKFVPGPAEIESSSRPRRRPAPFHPRVHSRQKRNDEGIGAKEEAFIAIGANKGVRAHTLEVPAGAVEFGEDNEVRRFRVVG
jgi:hypothetical protein